MTQKINCSIFYNPKCSTCRNSLALLKENDIEADIIEYLKDPPTVSELKDLLKLLKVPAKEIVRTKEDVFKKLDLDLDDEAAVIKALVKHPVLLQRPIVVLGKRAIIGRPAERVLDLLD